MTTLLRFAKFLRVREINPETKMVFDCCTLGELH